MIGDKKARQTVTDTNYIDNVEFTNAVIKWVEENVEFGKDRKQWSQMPEFIGECILKIVERFSSSGNWRGYTFIDEMRSEAISTCVRYAHNFNKEKSINAFAYFTQLTYNSFLQILSKEKIQSKIKTKTISEQSIYNLDNINLYDESVEQ